MLGCYAIWKSPFSSNFKSNYLKSIFFVLLHSFTKHHSWYQDHVVLKTSRARIYFQLIHQKPCIFSCLEASEGRFEMIPPRGTHANTCGRELSMAYINISSIWRQLDFSGQCRREVCFEKSKNTNFHFSPWKQRISTQYIRNLVRAIFRYLHITDIHDIDDASMRNSRKREKWISWIFELF